MTSNDNNKSNKHDIIAEESATVTKRLRLVGEDSSSESSEEMKVETEAEEKLMCKQARISDDGNNDDNDDSDDFWI
jgi:hypothetical protein